MSLLKTIKAQLGLSGTPGNNFVLDASADNGTMKLARGNAGATTQDIISVAANGTISFPQMAQLLGANGYIKLPGGLIIQWGTTQVSPPGGGTWQTATVAYPIPFPNEVLALFVNSSNNLSLTSTVINWAIQKQSLINCTISSQAATAVAGAQCFFLAIGR